MNHIVIIGFMGSGKTRVGKRLGKDLGLPFIDVDRLIVKKMNMSVKEVFERFGEPFYRALETMAVKELSTDGERKVISVSAGLPLQEQNQKYLQNMGTIIYLKGSAATLIKRLEGATIQHWRELRTKRTRSRNFSSREILFMRSLQTLKLSQE